MPVLSAEKEFLLSQPLACSLDGPCWIAQYPDHDIGPGASDSGCGSRSYHKHDGSDFAIPDHKTMMRGVDVLAIADGTVLRSRDGVVDQKSVPDSVNGIECGNGFVIDHGNGWQSQYCHLKQGSVLAKSNMLVKTGQVLGQVGQSGKAEFPHLHITLRHNNQPIDPFTATLVASACQTKPDAKTDLWRDDSGVIFRPVQISKVGLAGEKIDQEQINQNSQTQFTPNSDVLLVWAEIWGVRPLDRLNLTITAPDGKVIFSNKITLSATKARFLRFGGIKRKIATWPDGQYTGVVQLERDGMAMIEKKISLSPTK